jgi:hypothetical protein
MILKSRPKKPFEVWCTTDRDAKWVPLEELQRLTRDIADILDELQKDNARGLPNRVQDHIDSLHEVLK